MPFSRKTFSLFLSSSASTSPSHESPKTYGGGGGKRLTRLRKLRHVGDDEIDLQHNDFGSQSMPVSPDSYKNSGSSGSQSTRIKQRCRWSKSVEPHPLPLPEFNSVPKQSISDANLPTRVLQGDASNPAVIRSVVVIS